jgi:superfamily II DNA helicase RecQ
MGGNKNACAIGELNQMIRYEVPGVRRREWQLDAMDAVLQGLDVIVITGTGSGKSLVFQGLSFALPKGVVMVICPIKALMKYQVWPRLIYLANHRRVH